MRKVFFSAATIIFVMLTMGIQRSKESRKTPFSLVKALPLSSEAVSALGFSADGKELAVGGGEDGKDILFLSSSTWNPTAELHLSRYYPTFVSYSPNGKMLAVVGRGIEFFDAKTRKKLFTDEEDQRLLTHLDVRHEVPFSPDGKLFALGGGTETGTTFYLDLYKITPDGIKLVQRRIRPQWTEWGYPRAYALDFSPDGRFLAVGGGDGTLELWNVKAWKLLRRYQDPATRADTGWGWNPKSRRLSRVAGPAAMAHVGWVGYVEFSPDGKLLASADARHESSVKIWEVATGRLVHAFLLSKDPIDQTQGLDFSRDGKLLAACSMRKIAVFDVMSGKELWSGTTRGGFASVRFSPTQPIFAFLAASSDDPAHQPNVSLEIWQYKRPGE